MTAVTFNRAASALSARASGAAAAVATGGISSQLRTFEELVSTATDAADPPAPAVETAGACLPGPLPATGPHHLNGSSGLPTRSAQLQRILALSPICPIGLGHTRRVRLGWALDAAGRLPTPMASCLCVRQLATRKSKGTAKTADTSDASAATQQRSAPPGSVGLAVSPARKRKRSGAAAASQPTPPGSTSPKPGDKSARRKKADGDYEHGASQAAVGNTQHPKPGDASLQHAAATAGGPAAGKAASEAAAAAAATAVQTAQQTALGALPSDGPGALAAGPAPPVSAPAPPATAAAPAEPAPRPDQSASGHLVGLNSEQLAAVQAEGPVVRVEAGPGSGKTRTLVARVAEVLQVGGVEARAPCTTTPPTRLHAHAHTRTASDVRRATVCRWPIPVPSSQCLPVHSPAGRAPAHLAKAQRMARQSASKV